jgi:hypothetical protein
MAWFRVERGVPLSGTEGASKGIPTHRFGCIVGPSESVFQVSFDEAKAVLTSNLEGKFPCDRVSPDYKDRKVILEGKRKVRQLAGRSRRPFARVVLLRHQVVTEGVVS